MSLRAFCSPLHDDVLDAPAFRVDERLLRKVLDVNPGFARGRSLAEVKRALERPAATAARAVLEAAAESRGQS
jgi:hypothetical protein